MSILKLKDSQGNWIGVPTVKGSKGDKGNGISSAVLNNDYTLTLTFTDGTTYTTPSIRGEKGEQGEPATDMEIHICSASEYDSETRIPTIANPDDKTFYLVPTEDGTSPDLFSEWVYVNNAWEMFGSMKIDLSGYLTDVTVDGTSIVSNGVANVPMASSALGVVKINPSYGVGIIDGTLMINGATSSDVKSGNNSTKAVSTYKQHESAFYGLAKVAGHDEKDSTLPVGQYTDEAKASIQSMLGVPSEDEVVTDVQTNGTSITTDGVANIPIANTARLGVVKIKNDFGVMANGNGELAINGATTSEIKNGTANFKAITPIHQHESTFYGLAQASGIDEKDSILPLGQYSDEAKSSIQDMLDVPSTSELKEVNDSKADVIVESATGDIVSFDDGADDIPLKSLVVDINPVQNLNGYDSPWVGGGGKNLFDESKTIANVIYTFENGEWIVSAPYGQGGRVIQYTGGIPVSNGQTITISADVKISQGSESTNKQVCIGAKDSANNGSYPKTDITLSDFDTWERVSAQVTTTSDYVWVGIQPRNSDTNNVVTFKNLQVEVGSTATDWTPYENICPISGWEGCMIYDFGDNLFDYENDVIKYNYYRNDDGDEVSSTSSFYTETSYDIEPYQYIRIAASNDFSVKVYCLTQDNQWISRTPWYVSVNNALTIINPESNCHKIQLHFTTSMPPDLSTLRLSIGHHIAVRWQTEAGTVYGGKLNVLSGVMTVTHEIVDMGTLNPTMYTTAVGNLFRMPVSGMSGDYTPSIPSEIYCSAYKTASYTTRAANTIYQYSTGVDVIDNNYDNASDFKTAVSGVQVVYPLATPIEIQLTPQEVKSLLGQNNIWADTGDTSVEYCADTELYIKKVKPVVNVDDVQIDGQSIVTDGVANIPIAGSGIKGVVSVINSYGLNVVNGNIAINRATGYDFQNANNNFRPIVTSEQHNSVFYGLAKASGDTTQSQSSNTVGNYTDNAKDKIQTMLGVSPLIAPHESDPFESAHVIGELFIINGKLYRAKTALTAGEYINDGTNVEVVNTSDVYVKNTDIASTSKLGLVKSAGGTFGININELGQLATVCATTTNFKANNGNAYKPIASGYGKEAVFYYLAHASGDTTQSQSNNAVGTYTEEAKTAIKQMLGVHDTIDSFVEDVTGTDVTITGQPSYRYNCGELYSLTVTPPSSGTIDFRFTSGSTPTVLTLPSTVKMPEWWVEVEANTIYEMCITDGIYCGVMTWAI